MIARGCLAVSSAGLRPRQRQSLEARFNRRRYLNCARVIVRTRSYEILLNKI
jgi:hypothetical protein